MKINDQQLTQIDKVYIIKLTNQDVEALANLALMQVIDLKESRERLNQNPSNSSMPSGSLSPWDKGLPTMAILLNHSYCLLLLLALPCMLFIASAQNFIKYLTLRHYFKKLNGRIRWLSSEVYEKNYKYRRTTLQVLADDLGCI